MGSDAAAGGGWPPGTSSPACCVWDCSLFAASGTGYLAAVVRYLVFAALAWCGLRQADEKGEKEWAKELTDGPASLGASLSTAR